MTILHQSAAHDMAQRTTLQDALSYRYFDPEDDLCYLDGFDEQSIAFGLSFTPLLVAGSDIEPNIEAILTTLPPNSIVTIGKLSCPQVEGFLERWSSYRLANNPFPLLSLLTQKRRDHFLRCAAHHSLLPNVQFHPRMTFYYALVKIPYTGDPSSTVELSMFRSAVKDHRASVKGALHAALMQSDHMSESELKFLLRELLNPLGRPSTRLQRRNEQASLLDDIIDKDTRLHVDSTGRILASNSLSEPETAITCLTVDAWPKYHYLNAMARTLGNPASLDERITCPYWAYSIIHVLHPDKAKDDLFAKFGLLNKQTATESPWYRAMMGPLFERKVRAEALLKELDNGHTLVRTYGGINLYTPPAEAKNQAEYVKGLYRRIGCRLSTEPHIALPVFISSLPFQYQPSTDVPNRGIQRAQLVSSLNAVTTLQIQGDWRGTNLSKGGGLLLLSRSGQIAAIDFFQSSTNYNFIIAAASGSGKSFLTNEIVNDFLSRGGVARIIDVGRSYARLCEIMNGQNIIFSPDNPMSLNPFTGVRTQGDLNELMPLLKALLRLMAFPLTSEEDTPPFQYQLLEKAVQSVWDKHGEFAELRHISEWLSNYQGDNTSRASDLAIQLEPFSHGRYSTWFSGPRTISFNNPLVILELEELNQDTDLQAVVMQLVMFQVTKEMYLSSRAIPKLLVIDEAWAIMGGLKTGKFIETAFRRMRKYNGVAGVITQSFVDFDKSSASKAALENASWQLVLFQRKESLNFAIDSKLLSADPTTEELIRSVRSGDGFSEIFVRSEYGEGIYRFITDPHSYHTYSTKPADTNRIDALVAKGLTIPQAVDQLSNEFIQRHASQ